MIRLLWPTARPQKMIETCSTWLATARTPQNVAILVGVNIEAEAKIIRAVGIRNCEVIITGDQRKGPVWPTHCLAQAVKGVDSDILVLVSDDFGSPKDWDVFLSEQLSGFCGGLMVRDGVAALSARCMTLPILTYGALLKLNRIIYHPKYDWHYSDNELYENLDALGILKDARKTGPVFQHHHWTVRARPRDGVDLQNKSHEKDRRTFDSRMKMGIAERLVVA